MFDVFFSHNSKNKPILLQLADVLEKEHGLRPWLDKGEIGAGDNFFISIDKGLSDCRCCAVFIGQDGLGRHQREEIWAALLKRINSDDEFVVIPVLLPGTDPAALKDLPSHLSYYSHVQFVSRIDEAEPLERLIRSIKRSDLIDLTFAFERLANDGHRYRVSLLMDDENKAVEEIDFDLTRHATVRDAVVRLQTGEGAASDTISLVGVELWGRLVAGSIRQAFRDLPSGASYHIRLRLPPELEWLPWEALFDERRQDFIASNETFAIIRDLADDVSVPELRPPRGDKIRLLIAAPQGGKVDYAAESQQVAAALKSKLGARVEVRSAPGPVTLLALDELLRDCDIFHFIGHGRIGANGQPELLFNRKDADDEWVDVGTFSGLFGNRGVRLVILNCCFSGGLGPNATRSGFGPSLLRQGVPATIAMQFEIKDNVARAFSDLFYEFFVSNPLPGRVDFALQQTRRKLRYQFTSAEPRAFVTPQLFLARRQEQLLRVQLPYARPVAAARSGRGADRLPDALVRQLAKQRCIPIVGPGVFNAAVTRRADTEVRSALGPRELARHLEGQLRETDQTADSSFAELHPHLGDWVEITELQRVCQRYVDKNNRAALIDAIGEVYSVVAEPTSVLLQIAEWPAPAFVCTFFDALLENALLSKAAALNVVTAIDRDINERAPKMLVNLRGTWKAPNDLVLTEREEHDLLWTRFTKMNKTLATMLTGEVGRCPLYIGCSPRDMLVRRLTHHLMPEGSRNLGDAYFIASGVSDVDKSYWEQYPTKVHFIDCDVEAAVEELTARMKGQRT